MGLIPEDVISQVLDRTDIIEIISAYIPLKRAGRNFRALCPFHNEKTPSFMVAPDKQIFHCFGCGAGGNALTFVMRHDRMEFPEAIRFLAGKAGIVIPEDTSESGGREDLRKTIVRANEAAVEYFHRNLVSDREEGAEFAREYLKGRAVNLECVRKFQIGYAQDSWEGLIKALRAKGFTDDLIQRSGLAVKREGQAGLYDRFRGRVVFPIFDYRGRPVAFGARALKKDDKVKYINSPETPVYTKGQHLYGFNWAKDSVGREDAVIVVEGYMDFIRPFNEGVHNIVASLGTALTVDQIRLIRRYTRNVVMLFDMDTAGQAATSRSLDVLLEEEMNVRVATLGENKDPDAFLREHGVEPFRANLDSARSLFDFKLERLSSQYGTDTIEGRARVCQEIIPTLEKVKSEVVRDGYWRELAARLNVREEVILKERQRVLGKSTQRSAVVHKEKKEEERGQAQEDEKLLLRLMLLDQKWVGFAHQALSLDELNNRIVRLIVEKVFELFEAGKDVNVANLINHFREESMASALTAFVREDETLKGDQERMFDDCLRRIRMSRQKTERKRIREAIQTAEKAGKWDEVHRLQSEFNTLIKT